MGLFLKEKLSKKERKAQNKVKQFELSIEELEELVFYEKARKQRSMEAQMWGIQADGARQRVMERLAINPDEYQIDWSQVFQTGGKVFVSKLPPKPKVIEETKK